ncbi:hypothetical protein GYA27_03620 [candidate division WWE3 bacterium]|uniref:HAMP domain-containing protein n=1 Tax=candidate division WWE3 bacterium TaxID=2053526 RepID=A0A7X9DKU4_UNCKA|nr:hypothetical protein [candidate division WWE3 bacterium]
MINTMSLRVKVFLLILFLNLTAVLALNYVSKNILVVQLDQYKEKQLERNLRVLKKHTEEQISSIDNSVRDYAYWDDTYNFMFDLNPEYVESNLVKQTFANIQVDYMGFFDALGKMRYSAGYNHETGEKFEITPELANALGEISFTIYSEGTNGAGVITSGKKVYYIVSRPILKSDKTGPAVGTLMMLKEFDYEAQQGLKDLLQMNFEITLYSDVDKILNKAQTATLLDRNFEINNKPESAIGYILINDLENKPAFIISSSEDVTLITVISRYRRYINIISLAIFLFNLILAVVFMEKNLLGPLRHLVSEVDRIRTRKVASQRIVIKGDKELKELATNINSMLDTLDSFDKKLVDVNKEMESKATELEANAKELERLNKHMVGRELRMAELKEQLEELEFKLKQKEDAI